jgi:uncharacterized protein YjbI with pentapeptide repeats
MEPRELADLPYASDLRPHQGGLGPHEEYDLAHFDQLSLDDPAAQSARFMECAFTRVTFQQGQLRRARFMDVWLSDVRMIKTGLTETSWQDVIFAGAAIAGSEAYGSALHTVTFRDCKLDSVNFRDAGLTDVAFDNCLLREVDFGGAIMTRVVFTNSRLDNTDFSRVTLDDVDLRGAELGITITPGSLRGAIITSTQLMAAAPLLAETLGIVVRDDDESAGSPAEQ